MFKNKKGTEKPIEIFVALFVILAVALLLLQLFQSQLSDKQRELDEASRRAELDQIRTNAREFCNAACSEASSKGCSPEAMASLCIAYASDAIKEPKFLDLNNDGTLGEDDTLLAGVTVCEDAIPCHAMVDTCCGMKINHNTCKTLLEDYWNNQFDNADTIDDLRDKLVRTGTCYSDTDRLHWYNVGEFYDI